MKNNTNYHIPTITSELTQEERDELIQTMINYEDGLLTDNESLAMFQQLQEVTTFELVRNLSETIKRLCDIGSIPDKRKVDQLSTKKYSRVSTD